MSSDLEMFEWAEAQRAKASTMSNDDLARALLLDVMGSVGLAEGDHSCSKEDASAYDKQRGVLREAAFRLAGIKDYDQTSPQWRGDASSATIATHFSTVSIVRSPYTIGAGPIDIRQVTPEDYGAVAEPKS